MELLGFSFDFLIDFDISLATLTRGNRYYRSELGRSSLNNQTQIALKVQFICYDEYIFVAKNFQLNEIAYQIKIISSCRL